MSSISVTIDTSQFDKFAGQFPHNIARAIGNTVNKVTALIERGGKLRAPVDTGRMRSQIASTRNALTGEVRTHTNYAIYVHDGTRFMKGRPFLYDALKDAEQDIEAILDEELSRVT